MVLDPIRPNDPPAIPDAVSARAAAARVRAADVSAQPAAAAAKPVSISPPERPDEVSIKWEGDDGVVVTFTDKKSGEIFRQIPSEQVLSVVRFIRQMLEQQQSSDPESQASF